MKSKFLTKNIVWYFFAIFCVALYFITHLLNLGTVPRGLQADEASFLLNATSLVQTGKDEDGTRYPIWFNSLIDPKPALYSYLQVPFVAALGATTTASRIPAAVLGLISVGLVYWVLTYLVEKKHALLASLLLIISPWHSVVARSTQEVILAFIFSLIAVGAYLSILHGKRILMWIGVLIVSTVLAMYAYHSVKVFLPLLFLGWSTLELVVSSNNITKLRSKLFLHTLLMAIIFGVAIIVTFAFAQGLERFKAVGFLSEKGPLLIMEEQIRTATGAAPYPVIRVFYNKVVAFSFRVIDTYMQHFTADFFFIKGGQPDRYQVPFHGLLYHIELLLLPLGLFLGLHGTKTRKWSLYMLVWLLVAPLPAALTTAEVPSMIRSFPMIVPLVVFMSYALLWLWSKRELLITKIVLIIIFVGYVWGVAYFSQQLFIQQARYHPWKRNVAEEKLATWLLTHQGEYDRVHITTLRDAYMYIVLADPTLLIPLQNSTAQRSENFLLDKYFFKESDCAVTPYPPEVRALYVVRANCQMAPGFIYVDRIRYEDNAEAYDVYIFNHPKKEGEKYSK